MKILSGVFQDERMAQQVTTGTPIGLLIENVDARSKDYADIRDKFRPGHADYTYFAKFGIRAWPGGGRTSARETIGRVASGAIARNVPPEVKARGVVHKFFIDLRKSAEGDAALATAMTKIKVGMEILIGRLWRARVLI